MKLGIMEKLTIIIIAIFAVLVIIANHESKYQKMHREILDKIVNASFIETHELPPDTQKISKKYHAFEDIYNSKNKVFTYGYTNFTLEKELGEKFHKKLSKRYKKENLNFEFIPYKDWEDSKTELEIQYNNKSSNDPAACTLESGMPEELIKLFETTAKCMLNACIIDSQKGTYTVMSRNIDFIIEKLKENNPPAKIN